jgi:hypothetical protein
MSYDVALQNKIRTLARRPGRAAPSQDSEAIISTHCGRLGLQLLAQRAHGSARTSFPATTRDSSAKRCSHAPGL